MQGAFHLSKEWTKPEYFWLPITCSLWFHGGMFFLKWQRKHHWEPQQRWSGEYSWDMDNTFLFYLLGHNCWLHLETNVQKLPIKIKVDFPTMHLWLMRLQIQSWNLEGIGLQSWQGLNSWRRRSKISTDTKKKVSNLIFFFFFSPGLHKNNRKSLRHRWVPSNLMNCWKLNGWLLWMMEKWFFGYLASFLLKGRQHKNHCVKTHSCFSGIFLRCLLKVK